MSNLLNPPSPQPVVDNGQLAQEAHARGELAAAIQAQQAHLAHLATTRAATPDAHLFLALLHFQHGSIPESLGVIADALRQFPDSASLHENHGVLLLSLGDNGGAIQASRRALECGSTSPNTHDCLADAAGRIGRADLAVDYGRAALAAKDRMFSSFTRLATMPTEPPPPFNPHNRAENVISYSLWGENDRYFAPLAENLKLLNHLFPAWTIRVHLDTSVPQSFRNDLQRMGAQVLHFELPPNMPGHRRLLWRFAVLSDPSVRRYLIRDADSLLTIKERVAVDAWLASQYYFHIMRDFYTHTDLILAGMWGGVGGILPNVDLLFNNRRGWRTEGNHIDQDLLSETVWPSIRGNCLIHDSVFTGCLGSVPFPPYGELPPGHHIGQNAFALFARSS
ncbi:MAG: tetratricopeptide repeat protein [Alphaproteobacteria bacterium]|nr:tetratricopeptide repeat protein [Alphaproteobacteria bacterium]